MTPLAALLSRLREATCGSRELDGEIFCIIKGWIFEKHDWAAQFGRATFGRKDGHRMVAFWSEDIPAYTTSLDAALTLVPEGWEWTLYSDGSCEIYKDVPSGMLPGAPGSTVMGFDAETIALTLCIAALTARASQEGATDVP